MRNSSVSAYIVTLTPASVRMAATFNNIVAYACGEKLLNLLGVSAARWRNMAAAGAPLAAYVVSA